MNKKIVYIAAAFFLAVSVSCKKCVTCTYNNNTGVKSTAESCGKNNNEDLETDLNNQWGTFGPVSCQDQ